VSAAILIVDDSADYRRILSRIVTAGGYRPLCAGDAVEARRLLAENEPDAALLDWNMPGEDGIALAQELRRDARWSALPLIMLSVNSDPDDQARSLSQGDLDAYMTKPVASAELLARLKNLLSRRRHAR
jgi:DNA-binding response OmpR family regulator